MKNGNGQRLKRFNVSREILLVNFEEPSVSIHLIFGRCSIRVSIARDLLFLNSKNDKFILKKKNLLVQKIQKKCNLLVLQALSNSAD